MLEQNKRRSRMKLAVFCVLAVSVAGLSAILIKGCKREQTGENQSPPELTQQPAVRTPIRRRLDDQSAAVSTNPAAARRAAPPPVPPVVPEATGTEYTVVKGDTLAKIAKANGVTLKALEDANPGVVPTKLKINQKLTIPAGGAAAPAATGDSRREPI